MIVFIPFIRNVWLYAPFATGVTDFGKPARRDTIGARDKSPLDAFLEGTLNVRMREAGNEAEGFAAANALCHQCQYRQDTYLFVALDAAQAGPRQARLSNV